MSKQLDNSNTLAPWWADELRLAGWFDEPTAPPSGGSITGSASKTLGALTGSATGKVAIAGTASKTLGAVTGSATGKVAIAGSAAKTLGALTLSATGKVAITGTASRTLGALTSGASGAAAITGSGSATLGELTGTATGRLAITGTAAVTLGALTGTGSATMPAAPDIPTPEIPKPIGAGTGSIHYFRWWEPEDGQTPEEARAAAIARQNETIRALCASAALAVLTLDEN